MSRIRILIVGHSHIAALKKAGADQKEDRFELAFVNLNTMQSDTIGSSSGLGLESAVQSLFREFHPDAVVSCIGGNAHTIFGLVEHPDRFDFVCPDDENLPTDQTRQLVPYGAVRQMLESQMSEELQDLVAIRQSQDVPLIHVQSPPANPSESHIRQYPGAFKALMDARGVTPAAIRHKFWRLHSSIVRETCEHNDIHFLSVPECVQDEHGMLVQRDSCRTRDTL